MSQLPLPSENDKLDDIIRYFIILVKLNINEIKTNEILTQKVSLVYRKKVESYSIQLLQMGADIHPSTLESMCINISECIYEIIDYLKSKEIPFKLPSTEDIS